jgi:hypothetical protein
MLHFLYFYIIETSNKILKFWDKLKFKEPLLYKVNAFFTKVKAEDNPYIQLHERTIMYYDLFNNLTLNQLELNDVYFLDYTKIIP